MIDPDMLARSMPVGNAMREALRRRRSALEAGRSHLVETTLSGTGVLRHIKEARRMAYWVVLHYVSLESPDQALDRIRNRVKLGGHDVPEADVRRRFLRSHANLPTAAALVNEVCLHDNTSPDSPHREFAILSKGKCRTFGDVPDWAEPMIALVKSHM
ncbi:MAG: hypothetical protein OXB95_03830 [Rhodobacteraceae bacterium]|nr:hypothetical protein [Paracoccaceae bacterium]